MFNTKRIEALEARVAELEAKGEPEVAVRGPERLIPDGWWLTSRLYHIKLSEAVGLLIGHLGLEYEPKKETSSGPKLVKSEPGATVTIYGYTPSGRSESRQNKKRKGGKR